MSPHRLLWLALLLPASAFAAKGAGQTLPALPEVFGAPTVAGEVDAEAWWRRLGDPALASLVEEGLGANLDLAAADARIRQAEALQLSAVAATLPSLSFDVNLNAQPANRRFVGFTGTEDDSIDPALLYYQGSAGLNGAWELDLTGRNILGAQAATQDKRASDADLATQSTNLASRIAGAWFDAALQAERLRLLLTLAEANRGLLEVVQLRLDRGEATAVDLLQQRQQVLAVESQLPLVRGGVQIAGQQLAVLVGRTPDRPPATLPEALPELPAPPASGRPEDLLEHRPDLRAAEARLDGAWQRRMAAERALLPTLRASANAGWSFTNNAGAISFGLPDPNQPDEEFQSWFNWGVGGTVSVPLFNLRTIATIKQVRATERLAASQLGQAELTALSQVEGALTQDGQQAIRLRAVRDQVEAARAAYEAARSRYAEGIGDYLSLLTTLVTWQNAELTALQAHRDALAARVQLHEALGGPWTDALSGGSR